MATTSITIAEAIAIANQCGETESTESYYVYGKIVNVSNPNYGEMTISDGTDSIYVYGVIYENGAFYNTIADKPVAGILLNGIQMGADRILAPQQTHGALGQLIIEEAVEAADAE